MLGRASGKSSWEVAWKKDRWNGEIIHMCSVSVLWFCGQFKDWRKNRSKACWSLKVALKIQKRDIRATPNKLAFSKWNVFNKLNQKTEEEITEYLVFPRGTNTQNGKPHDWVPVLTQVAGTLPAASCWPAFSMCLNVSALI